MQSSEVMHRLAVERVDQAALCPTETGALLACADFKVITHLQQELVERFTATKVDDISLSFTKLVVVRLIDVKRFERQTRLENETITSMRFYAEGAFPSFITYGFFALWRRLSGSALELVQCDLQVF